MSLVTWAVAKVDRAGNEVHRSGPKTEYLIHKETYFWVLTYPSDEDQEFNESNELESSDDYWS